MSIEYTPNQLPEPQRINMNINRFFGVNKTGTAEDGEFTDCKNMSCDKFPYASTCAPKEVVKSGIQNPQNIMFCDDKLAYISGGDLYIKNGEVFENKGTVGTVTSVTEFSNTKTLFFPSNMVYDSETESLTAMTSYLLKNKGSYNQNNEYSEDTFSGDPDDYEGVYMLWRSRSYSYWKVAPIAIIGSAESNYIFPSQLKDENGNPIKDGDKTKYGSITINVSGSCVSNVSGDKTPDNVNIRLFVHAWDENGNLLTPLRSGHVTTFACFDFGEPITFTDGYASKLLIQIGYFKRRLYDGSYFECDSDCLSARNKDFANSDFKLWISESTYPAPNSKPHIDYACTDNNRVAGVSKNSFYASSLGDYTNWVDFVDADGNPKETGAYAEELNTFGDFTGCFKYGGSVVLTKADRMYICYGNKPPYRITEGSKTGCIDSKSMAECDGYLYFLGRDGFYRFSGGTPVLISEKLNKTFVSGVGIAYGKKYYCCAYDGEKYGLYCYSAVYGMWHIEDDRQYVSFAVRENELYGLTAGGEIIKFNSGDEAVKWDFTTKQFDFDTNYTKNLAKVYCRLRLHGQAWVDIYIRSNKTEWHKFANCKADSENVIQAKCKVKKCDFIQLKFVGKGQCEIMDIYSDITVGTKKHRAGKNLTVFRKG